MEISKDTIGNYVKEWVNDKIGVDFKFRQYQFETIVNIIDNIISHRHRNYVIEAPTGSGKSLINIISAGVLADYFELTSYILVSDLFLWEQYEKFLKKYRNTNIASIKGQTGNYTCALNKEDMKNADCKMAGLSWASMFSSATIEKYGYDCAYTCEYVKARKKAIKAKVCVMTYQLFLFVMNNNELNSDSHGVPIFKPHDVLFCDECHNIPGIVQQQYAPTIKETDFDKLEIIYNGSNNNVDLFDTTFETDVKKKLTQFKSSNDLRKELNSYWKTWSNPESRKDEDYECMNKYKELLEAFMCTCNDIKDEISRKKTNGEYISKEDISLFKTASWYENYMCHWNDFNNAICNTGTEFLLKDITISNEDKHMSIAFKCTKEDFLVFNYLLRNAPYKVFLSATVGGKDAYDENMGFRFDIDKSKDEELNKSIMDVIPSTFDFTESPVWFLNKFKMSFKEKEISFRHLKNIIYSICKTKFSNQKGMIQTGSYAFAKQLYEDAPYEIKQRMLVYNGSREKNTVIQIHQMSSDTILVGPTLNEGIDLPGDDCRFIIILKVPYPSLGDKLVKEKIKLFPLWYNSTTSNEIIQGIGRGVRYDGDWCVTYILDACFWNLYLSTKEQYSIELQNRIKMV